MLPLTILVLLGAQHAVLEQPSVSKVFAQIQAGDRGIQHSAFSTQQSGRVFRKGQLLENIASDSSPDQRFILYIPTGYTPSHPAPILYLMDPRGRARIPAQLFQRAAERFGYILVSSYNTMSDQQMEPNMLAVRAMWTDTHDWFAIDDRRVYLAGFSGTARTSCLLAHHMPGAFTGVIAAGASFHPSYPPSRKTKFLYFAAVGDVDYNFHEMQRLDSTLASLDLPYRFAVFPGPHSWMTPEVAGEAVEWLELRAMQSGSRERDEGLIDSWWARDLSAAEALAGGGRLIDASRRYAALARDFSGLRETANAAAKVVELSKQPDFQKQLKQRQQATMLAKIWIDTAMIAIKEAFATGADAPTVPASELAATLEISRLKKAAAGPDAAAALEAQRRLNLIEVQLGFYLPKEAIELTEHVRAAYYLSLAVQIDAASPVSWYLTAVARARLREPRLALAALESAIDAGFRDLPRLQTDPAFARLRSDPRFVALVDRLEAAGDTLEQRGIDRLPLLLRVPD